MHKNDHQAKQNKNKEGRDSHPAEIIDRYIDIHTHTHNMSNIQQRSSKQKRNENFYQPLLIIFHSFCFLFFSAL
jgi:hypothetical protein